MMKDVSHMKYSHNLIMDDFNYIDINWTDCSSPHNEDHLEFTFLKSIRDTFLHQHVTELTRGRIGHNVNTLDLIFSNEEGMLYNLEHLCPLGKSDHCILFFDFNCYFVFNTKQKVHRFYDKGVYINMEKDLDLDWEVKFESIRDDVNAQWHEFSKTLTEAEEKWVPSKTFSGEPRCKEYGEVTLEASSLKKIRKKHRCWQHFLETKDGEKWDKYCRQQRQVRDVTRQILRSTEKGIAKDTKKNTKKFWVYPLQN